MFETIFWVVGAAVLIWGIYDGIKSSDGKATCQSNNATADDESSYMTEKMSAGYIGIFENDSYDD